MKETSKPTKTYPTLGCCGIDCGLCPKYYTIGSSKCPGCCGPGQGRFCSFVNCCIKKKGLEVCAECDEFPCSKFKPLPKWITDIDSFLADRLMPNLNSIKEHSINQFIEQQKRLIALLDTMLHHFNDGRSKRFYCSAVASLSITDLEKALENSEEMIKRGEITSDDFKTKAQILKGFLNEIAIEQGVVFK